MDITEYFSTCHFLAPKLNAKPVRVLQEEFHFEIDQDFWNLMCVSQSFINLTASFNH